MIDSFASCRPRLVAVAYGMLGSMMDAEDVVQDAWIRWRGVDHDVIRSPIAYLTTMVTRMSIDRLRSARRHRETYVGPWLPEPITEQSNDPADIVAEAERFSLAFLHAMERLNPVERAVLLLREGFDYDYAEIAGIVDRTPENCRQIASRARGHVAEPPTRRPGDVEGERRVVTAAMEAVVAGDVDRLLDALAGDIVAWSDGGAARRAARHPIVGAQRVARFLVGIARQGADMGASTVPVTVGGDPGVRIDLGGEVYGVMTFRVVDGRIQAIRSVINPEKLAWAR